MTFYRVMAILFDCIALMLAFGATWLLIYGLMKLLPPPLPLALALGALAFLTFVTAGIFKRLSENQKDGAS